MANACRRADGSELERRFYEEYARIQDQHWWFAGRREIVRSVLAAELGNREGEPPLRILDVGCGTGTNLPLLREFGQVEGVDTELAAVQFCRHRGETGVRHAAGSELPFADGRFDLVTLLDVIEHVRDDQPLLDEARRVLSSGGLVLVTVPAYTWMWGAQDEISHHYRRYTRPRLRTSLMLAGFEPLMSSYFNTLLFPPIAAMRLFRRLRPPSGELRSDFELNRPGPLNWILARLFSLEAKAVPRTSLPFGVSILELAGVR